MAVDLNEAEIKKAIEDAVQEATSGLVAKNKETFGKT